MVEKLPGAGIAAKLNDPHPRAREVLFYFFNQYLFLPGSLHFADIHELNLNAIALLHRITAD
ncbi:MAG: hypothetical protein HF314_06470 [Ignavibacteria bacterium]|nr:hypothetical protein [Ignavibacteria bacterium]MCU7502699.1 hypothetical protein [Ignavibacteria bacterium]MCU7517372.1 hypothetical protein [Ignavibacteria bacterium]